MNQTGEFVVMESYACWIIVHINYNHKSKWTIFHSLYMKPSTVKYIYMRVSLENDQLEEYKYTCCNSNHLNYN